jgi:hypothetical protein
VFAGVAAEFCADNGPHVFWDAFDESYDFVQPDYLAQPDYFT